MHLHTCFETHPFSLYCCFLLYSAEQCSMEPAYSTPTLLFCLLITIPVFFGLAPSYLLLDSLIWSYKNIEYWINTITIVIFFVAQKQWYPVAASRVWHYIHQGLRMNCNRWMKCFTPMVSIFVPSSSVFIEGLRIFLALSCPNCSVLFSSKSSLWLLRVPDLLLILLNQTAQSNYNYVFKPRSSEHMNGLAIIFKNKLRYVKIVQIRFSRWVWADSN